jgi:uncharacterized protein YjbI with pentapeptide repeats
MFFTPLIASPPDINLVCYMQVPSGQIIDLEKLCGSSNQESFTKLLSTKECQNCDLSRVQLVNVDLSNAKLAGANLTGANLVNAKLSGADLSGANLSGANLDNVDITNVNLSKAILPDGTIHD